MILAVLEESRRTASKSDQTDLANDYRWRVDSAIDIESYCDVTNRQLRSRD